MLQISGPNRFITLSNGSCYEVDCGIQPDVPLTRIDCFHDREALTELVNGMFR